jgi:hypothetical protein
MTACRQQRDADAVNPRVPGFDRPVASVSFETVLVRTLAYNISLARTRRLYMSDTETYSWLPSYLCAVLETDNARMPTRIYEALAAIEQRRPSLTATDGIEEREIENAQRGLLALKTERAGGENATGHTRVSRAGQQSEGTD